jgi:hypothetical protein
MIHQIFWINLFLFIWFNTDAFLSYCKLFKIDSFKIKEFNEYSIENPKSDYLSFLRIKHFCFIVDLITCKPCLCFWISLIFTFCNILNFPIVYLISYILYKILNKYVY